MVARGFPFSGRLRAGLPLAIVRFLDCFYRQIKQKELILNKASLHGGVAKNVRVLL